ncbi:MAG TPA: PEP-CTERM sorting domain-containing protein [Terriglobales bacterium]|nr:PEP-CTERM sorting domain-containing protein [Terriglobales bacterium]
MKHLLASSLAVMAFTLVSPGHAVAAALLIDDTSPNDTITFSLNDFEGGFKLNGSIVQQGLNSPVSVTVPESETAGASIVYNFSGRWIDNGQTIIGVHNVAFVEPGTDPRNGVSDILTYAFDRVIDNNVSYGTIAGTFQSDTESLLQVSSLEGFDLTSTEQWNFSNAFLTAIATSDVEATIPEPGTIALLGLGLAGLGFGRRQRTW